MNLEMLSMATFALAAIPCGLFLLNLLVYRPLVLRTALNPVSVLIPARNEACNIRATLEAVLSNQGCNFEVIVLDDHSTDDTAGIVSQISRHDGRVRLEAAPPLPVGWCGKQHACHVLARLARNPLLIFMDADVRLAPDALVRMVSFMEKRGTVALASGVPLQELGTLSEKLLIPLIHFILLGFLPIHVMRWTRWPAMSAGCGQLFIVRRDAYEACGGHAMLRESLHDGIKLPRVFRKAGLRTDLFDATDLATCRMYQTNVGTWNGLGKNATEGLAAPATILPMTILLLGGQVLPFVLVVGASLLSTAAFWLALFAMTLVYLPRMLAMQKFRQPFVGVLLHPLAVVALLVIQWCALTRHLLGRPAEWKGRRYDPTRRIEPLKAT